MTSTDSSFEWPIREYGGPEIARFAGRVALTIDGLEKKTDLSTDEQEFINITAGLGTRALIHLIRGQNSRLPSWHLEFRYSLVGLVDNVMLFADATGRRYKLPTYPPHSDELATFLKSTSRSISIGEDQNTRKPASGYARSVMETLAEMALANGHVNVDHYLADKFSAINMALSNAEATRR